MLRTASDHSTLRDILRQGWVSSAGFLTYCLFNWKDDITRWQFQAICQRFISTAGISMDFFLGMNIAITSRLTTPVEKAKEKDGYSPLSQSDMSSTPRSEKPNMKMSQLLEPDGCIQIVSLYCHDYKEIEAMNSAVENRAEPDPESPYDVQGWFMLMVANKQYRRVKERRLSPRLLDACYTMVETFVNSKQERVHVYCLARKNPENPKDEKLYLCELIVVPAALDERGISVTSFNTTGEMDDLDFSTHAVSGGYGALTHIRGKYSKKRLRLVPPLFGRKYTSTLTISQMGTGNPSCGCLMCCTSTWEISGFICC